MISISVSTGTFAVETGPDTAEAAGTSAVNNDVETDLESGGGNYSQSENNVEGGSSDGTGEPSETSAPAETSVTEPSADTEVTTATGETSAETTAPAEDTYGDTSNADETDMNTQETSETDETEETEQDEIDLLELEQHIHDDIVFEPLNSENIYSGSYYLAADNVKISDIDGKVDLCLNGKSIKHSGFFYIEANTVLNIYDDYAPGENVQIYIDGIYMGLGGANQTINIHGGYVNLSSDVDSNNPCTINVYDGKFDSDYSIGPGTLNIYGGEIDFPNLDISDHDGTLTLSGNPKMDGTTITTKTDNPIKITGQLGADVKCKVQLGEFGKYDGTGLFAELSDESYASESNFISPEGYTVVKVGTKLYLTDHLHEDGTAFVPWTETDSLPTESGSYYLTDDVNSAYGYSYLEVKDTTINLCLNGHNISRVHLENATLNIYDETGVGKISGIVCQGGAVLNIYGGTLEDSGISLNLQNYTNNPNVVHIYGGTINSGQSSAINIEGSSDKVEISGGTINCGTKNGGINVYNGTLTISGEPTISGNYSGFYGAVCFGNDNSFYLSGSPTINGKNGSQALRARGNNIININGKLTPKEPITIALPPESEKETYLFAVMEDESYADASAFAAYDEGYTIVKNGKKLYLTKQQETHEHDGKVFTPWLDTESLPTTSGSYYLTKDVHINNARYTISSDIDLCLHGHSISFELEYDSAWLYIDDGSNFNLYDDENKGKVEGILWINRGGNAIIYGGTFDFYIAVDKGGKAVIKDGMFSKGCQLNGGDLTIDGGTIETQGVAIQLRDNSSLTINNGSIKSKGSMVIDSAALNPYNAAITINGGTITGEMQSTPVIAVSDRNKLTVTGGTISGSRSINSSSKDFYLSGNAVIDGNIIIAVYPINIVGELTNTDPYVIYMQTPGVFATGEFAAQSADKFTPSAELASEGYTVVVTENDELAIDYRHYTYGDNGEFKLLQMKPPRPTSLDSGIAVISLPENCDLKVNGKTVTDATVIEESTNYKYIISVKISRENGFNIGENEIQGLISSNEEQTNVNDSGSYSIKVIVDPKPISAEFADDPAKTYDGNTDCEAEFTSNGFVKGDDVSITAEHCEFDSADVGTRKVTAYGLTITGDQKDFYKLEEDEIIGSGEITPKPLDIPESEFTYNGETVLEVELDGENGEKVTATLTAYSKNAGTYTYNINAADGFYTAELSSANYSIDKAGALTIDPRVAEIEWQDETTFVYDGEAKIVKAALSNKVANDDVEFEFKGNVGTKAGTYTAGVVGFIGADKGNYTLENAENKEQSWKITAANSGLTLTAENKTVTYGGNISLTATVKRTSTNGIMTMSAAPDKVDFYIGDDLIGTESVTYTDGSNGTAVLELPATSAKHFKAGENTIRAEYGGSGDLLVSSGEIVIKVEPKPVTADIVGVTSKTYDGTNVITDLSLQLDGIESCDAGNVEAAAESYTFNSANVNEATTITANGAALFGTQAENYKLIVNTAQGEITPAKVDIPESDFTYDGETVRKVEIDGVNGEKVTATLTAYSKNAGTYTYDVTASAGKYTAELSSTNYSIDTAGALTIDPRVAEIEWQDEISFDYDGTEKSVAAEVTNTVSGDALNIAYKNNKAADVGEYTAEITSLGDDNYTLDGAENVTLAWEISAVGREETNVAIDYIGETLSTSDDMEYSTDGETWLPCAENMSVKAVGWNESESLTVKFRYAADKNHTAGKIQNVTIPPRPAAPDISEVTVTKTQDSITVTEIVNCEYSIDGTTWQDSGTFEGLTEGTECTVQIRTKADESKFASFAAEKTVVTSDTSSGTTDLKEGETVETDSGSITNDGKNVEIEDNNGNKTTVTLPDGASDSVEVDESGNVKVPDGSVVETGDTTVTLPDGGTVSPDGTITADKVVIGDTTVSGDEVTVMPDGDITVSENGTVQSRDTTVELPDGGTVSPDGTITADKVVIDDTTVSGDEVTVTPDGDITVSENGTVQSGDTTVELPDGGTVNPNGTITADKVVIGDTTVSGDDVTVTPDGDITVSENGNVQSGDTTVELPDGGTVSPDGTITADKVVIGDTTASGDEVTVTPDGNITVSGNGTIQSGDTTVTGDEVTVTSDGNITVSGNGEVQDEDTIVTGETVTVDKDGNIAIPNGGTVSANGSETVIGNDGSIKNNEVGIEPVDSVGYCDENGENYSLSNGYIVLDIESADDDEIVKDLESESDISVIKAYDIKLLYNGKFEVQPNGTVKVTIAAPTGVDGTEKVLHINENGFEDMNAEYDRNSNTFSFKTDHFSIYVIAASDDDPIVPPPTSSGSTQTHPIEPEETTGSEETTSPEETTVPEETTAPEETTVPEETTAPEETTSSEETTVPEETAKPEETTDYPTDVSGDNSENNPPTGVSPDLAVLATAAFTVAAALFLKKKRSSDK